MADTLSEHLINPDPIQQFSQWFSEVQAQEITMHDAMVLATVNARGIPSARFVLLKSFDTDGFVFFTNYNSEKARELSQNPYACCVLYWKEVERQVRIWGKVERISREASETYFRTRPRDSQLSAWASDQSSVIPNREYLIQRYKEVEQEYGMGEVPCPPHWGGYRLIPDAIEFWQGQASRLHDRIKYIRNDKSWSIVRLAP